MRKMARVVQQNVPTSDKEMVILDLLKNANLNGFSVGMAMWHQKNDKNASKRNLER